MMSFVDRISQLSTASMQNLVAIVFSHYFKKILDNLVYSVYHYKYKTIYFTKGVLL